MEYNFYRINNKGDKDIHLDNKSIESAAALFKNLLFCHLKKGVFIPKFNLSVDRICRKMYEL
jgi:hypothetical protein